MTSIFGSTADDYQRQQGKFVSGAINRSNSLIDSSKATDWLTKAQKDLSTAGLGKQSGTGPGFNFGINNGKLNLDRTGETQGYMDALLQGRNSTDSNYGALLSRLGFGEGGPFSQLASERDKALELAKKKSVGDLRSQLAKRRVQGASFAEDQVKGVEAEYDRQRDLSRAESIVQDLQMTKEVISERTNAWISSLTQSFQQLQFEGASMLQLQSTMQQGLTKLAELRTGLAEMGAKLTLEGQMAKAGISANLSNTQAGSYPGFAELESQENAGYGAMIGGVAGTILGGPIGGSIGSSLFGGSGSAGTNTNLNPQAPANLPWSTGYSGPMK